LFEKYGEVVASKEVGLEVNLEKTKYMLMSCSQKIGQKHSIKIVNRSSEDVAKFKFLGTIPTDQNYMDEGIKSRLHLGMLATIQFRVFCPPACCLGT
jgi:Ni,Fe-hydrogenase I large subunit